MISKTKGVVIHYLKYQESSIIVKIFTEDFGLVSFIINGIRSQKSKRSIGYFQPFSLLDLVVYMKSGREIQRLSEYKYLESTPNITQDVRKSSIVLFLSEILGRVMHQEHGNQYQLFDYLRRMIMIFDAMKHNIENFHLHFLIHLTPFLGIEIEGGDSLITSMEREITDAERPVLDLISTITHHAIDEKIETTGSERMKALQLIIDYYQHHGAQIGEIKSLKVLHQVFT